MNDTRTYLDYNATAPLRPQALARLTEALAGVGNPSSVHDEGRKARRIVEGARADVAQCLNAPCESITFTSGGTEANNLAIKGVARANGIESILVSEIEHPSVLETARRAAALVIEIPVDASGTVDLDAFETLAAAHPGALVSIMLANNETGVIQPVASIARIAHENGSLVHTDALQAAGKVPLDYAELGADLLALSAHKLGGPQAVGALVCRPGLECAPEITGGGQERKHRAGTENVAGIASFAAAFVAAVAELELSEVSTNRRDALERKLQALHPELRVFGATAPRLANTSCFAVPGVTAEFALIALDLEGVSVSSGSACSSGKVAQSHVLRAMQVEDELIRCALRVSFGWNSADADAERFVEAWKKITNQQSPAGIAAE